LSRAVTNYDPSSDSDKPQSATTNRRTSQSLTATFELQHILFRPVSTHFLKPTVSTSYMARVHRVAAYTSVFLALYLLAIFSVIPIPLIDADVSAQILPLIPWWLLVAFGSYSLWSLGWGVFTFRDCPEAYHELLKEINDAKNDLRGRGVTVD